MATIQENRPRNPDHIRGINEFFNEDSLRKELEHYKNQDMPDRSIDYHLENTDDFVSWANKKRKGTNLDPENRKPTQISDSPLSDYDIEFTRLNKTDSQVSALSSLSIPVVSNGSLSMLECSTPRSSIPNRKSITSNRRSGLLTPKLIIRQRHSMNFLNGLTASERLKRNKMSLIDFSPPDCSTPVRSADRTKTQRFRALQNCNHDPLPIASPLNNVQSPGTPIENANITNNVDKSERTLTKSNGGSESASATIIPETQDTEKNDSIIPETQDNDIPDTQNDCVLENTQDKSYIPETQDDNTATTQNIVATDPVQAPVSNETTKQQAEPQNVSNISTRGRISSRPPIRNTLQNVTQSKYVPLTDATGKSTPKTPSRIPRIASTITKNTLKPALPIAVEDTPKIGEPNVTNASKAAGPTIVVVASPKSTQPHQSSAALSTVVPAPNMTINVNVNSSMPQSTKQTSQTNSNNNNGQIVNDSRKSVTKTTKSRLLSTSSNSLMTNDSEASEDGNISSATSQLETPHGKNDSNKTSAQRQLFPTQMVFEPVRRSATFNKGDNLTQTIRTGDSIASTIETTRTRKHTQSIPNEMSSKLSGTPRSQTFVKPKISMPQNATYDISYNNESTPCHQQYDQSENGQGSNINMANVPSEAFLSQLTDDSEDAHNENHVEEHIANGSSDQSDDNLSLSQRKSKTNDKQTKSTTYNSQSDFNSTYPIVLLSRIDGPKSSLRSTMNGTNIFRGVRESEIYAIDPPAQFRTPRQSIGLQNEDIIDEVQVSPASCRRRLSEPEQSTQPTEPQKRRSKKRQSKKKDEAEARIEESLNQLKRKKSQEGKARRLTSVEALHPDRTFEEIDVDEIPRESTSTASFKVPDVPDATSRKSRSKSIRKSNANAELPHTDELVVEVNIEPIYDDEPDAHHITNSTESNVLTGLSPVVSREPSPVPETQRKSRSTAVNSKAASKPKNKAKEPEVIDDVDVEEDATDADADLNGNRRSHPSTSKSKQKTTKPSTKKTTKSKKRTADPIVARDIESNDEHNASNNAAIEHAHSRRPKRAASDSSYVQRRMSLLKGLGQLTSKRPLAVENNVDEPPNKRQKSNHIHKTVRSTMSSTNSSDMHKSVRPTMSSTTSNDGRKSAHPSTSSNQSMAPEKPSKSKTTPIKGSNRSTRISFIGGNRGEKRLEKSKFWKDFLDISKKNRVTHEDAVHFNCADGTIETAYTEQIEFNEIDGVDYGLMASKNYHVGFMRFPPGSKKAKGKSSFELDLCVIRGSFTVSSNDGKVAELVAATEFRIQKDAFYEVINVGQIDGIIQFAYVSSF